MAIIHVIPENDLKEHLENSTCDCSPRVEIVEGGMIIIHNAWDNQEIVERAQKIINQKKGTSNDDN